MNCCIFYRYFQLAAVLFAGSLAYGCGASTQNPVTQNVGIQRGVSSSAGAPAAPLSRQTATHTFQAGSAPQWQMVSAPFAISQSFASMGIYAAVYNPATNAYAVTPTPPADLFKPGQGYWFFVTQNIPISANGTAVDSTRAFSIALQPGWNQVGDPFTLSVSLSNLTIVDQASGISTPFASALAAGSVSPLYPYDPTQNSYITLSTNSQTINPWAGEWLYTQRAATLVVGPPSSQAGAIAQVVINSSVLSVETGRTVQLTATAQDASGQPISVPASNFQWSSSDPSRATVDASTGIVTGVSPGQVTISATESSSGVVGTILITIISRLTAINLSPPSLTLRTGTSAQLFPSGVDNAGNPFQLSPANLIWQSDNTNVAIVDNNGNVTAEGLGTANVSVTHTPTHVKGTAVVTVVAPGSTTGSSTTTTSAGTSTTGSTTGGTTTGSTTASTGTTTGSTGGTVTIPIS